MIHGAPWKRPARSSPAGRLHPRDGALQRKKAGRGRRGQPPALDSLSGNEDSAKAEHLPAPRLHGTACRKKAPARMRTIWPCRGPASQGRWQSLDLSVLPLAADMATAVGHGRFGSAKGALGGSAGTALASAYRMAVATDIAANITFVDRSRKTAGGTHRHGLPLRIEMTLSGSECLILLRDRSRSRDLWKTFPDFSLFHLYY